MATGNKITTLLLDCDNTLVLSEDLAFAVCADLFNNLVASYFGDLRVGYSA